MNHAYNAFTTTYFKRLSCNQCDITYLYLIRNEYDSASILESQSFDKREVLRYCPDITHVPCSKTKIKTNKK